jgi:hypothetical protein
MELPNPMMGIMQFVQFKMPESFQRLSLRTWTVFIKRRGLLNTMLWKFMARFDLVDAGGVMIADQWGSTSSAYSQETLIHIVSCVEES